jgi:hypothetical protein
MRNVEVSLTSTSKMVIITKTCESVILTGGGDAQRKYLSLQKTTKLQQLTQEEERNKIYKTTRNQ